MTRHVQLAASLSIPVIGAPMFIVSTPALVIAQCLAGIVGSMPALNARPPEALDAWLTQIETALAAARAADPAARIAPYAINQIIHSTNTRLQHDLDVCEKHRVPLIITSLSAPTAIVPRVHAWGGLVFHDVISVRHAQKAIEAGVDGLILVCAGAGGHAGLLSPFALVEEVRRFWDGPIALSGAIATGRGVLAAEAIGADLAYVGTRFIATREANAPDAYKRMIVDSTAADIVYSPCFTGVAGNYLRGSIVAAGLDPDALPTRDKTSMNFAGEGAKTKAWKDIWGAGQGVGAIDSVEPVAAVVARMIEEYRAAKARCA
ncbi:MAG: nitronate monooxygenase [Methylobacteriaceae bacterium]|nr:nitronate monooxygenase [Methylobacteriaceae bacterium]